MKKLAAFLPALVGALAFAVPTALAGNPHQVQSCTVVESGSTLTVSCKEAGLGDEAQIEINLSATAECINPGSHHPRAANKTSINATFFEPVQNGKADFTETVTASFQPECSPPMSVEFTDVTVTDVTNGITLFTE